MRLPRITIEYQEEETCAPGKLSFALIAGFGLHWAWVYLFMFDGAQLFSLPPAEPPPPRCCSPYPLHRLPPRSCATGCSLNLFAPCSALRKSGAETA